MKKKAMLLFLCFSTFVCCQEKKENKSDVNNIKSPEKSTDMLEKILKKQLKEGANKFLDEAGLELKKRAFEIEELDATLVIISNILKSNGYIQPNNKYFSVKIKNVFGRTIDFNSDNKYLYINFTDQCDKKMIFFSNNGIDYNGTNIVKNENFITDFYYLPEIFDYTKEFSDLKNIENEKIFRHTETSNSEIQIPHWKDIKDLAKQRKNNIQIIVARNMYLFNDSQAYFKWLILNDEYFMRSLVTTFGYYEDKELVKWVADQTEFINQNIEEANKIIYNKKCDGKIVFSQQLLTILAEDKAKATQFYELVHYNNYTNWLLSEKSNVDLTFSQKAEIIARIHSFIYSHKENYRIFDFMGVFAEYFDSDNKYTKEFKLKNYYNIPEFEEQWKQAKIDGDGISLPGEE
ncbi:hypothetical protein [Flavobacterium piscis]|uniref:Lipoprotein n=1 Tax=Flavobacterium piscis TaxID=1114874 RepID=A0ABU1YD93_9FLAO|nr:hypothetical protein [Flavobacterium piscis]MDR7212204.1 hypothetical protein [Flavobacterium piscis]